MPLEKSHVIVICSVSPLIVGLAAYYWYWSRKSKGLFIEEEEEEEEKEQKTNSVDIAVPQLGNEASENSEMTRQRRSAETMASPDIMVPGGVTQAQPIPMYSSKGGEGICTSYHSAEELTPEKNVHNVPVSGITTEDLSHISRADDRVDEELNSMNVAHSANSDHSDPSSHSIRGDSNFSDTHTEVSADSGLGAISDNIIFKFDFPSDQVGLLIGTHGRTVRMLQEKSGARVRIERSTYTSQYQVCVVEGSSHSVDVALELIRDRFPHLDLSQLTGDQNSTSDISSAPLTIPQLRIPQHTMSDVCISNVVTANHLYLQQPTHPYFRELEVLTQQMNAVYSDYGAPPLPENTPVGVICAAPWVDQVAFCRALILSYNEAADSCLVRYVDHGSTVELPLYSLRQIRTDFLRLPFQATECYLSNISPLDGQEEFSEDAAAYLQKVTEGCVLLCWVHGYADDSMPLVELYLRHGAQKVSLNKLLVENGYAKWVENSSSSSSNNNNNNNNNK